MMTEEDEMPNTLSTSTNIGTSHLMNWGVAEFEEGDHDIYI